MGNHECPFCRKALPHKRILLVDETFDNIIAALYPNIKDKSFQDVELNEEERAHNEKIQASLAHIFQQQSKALPKRLRIPTTKASGSRREPGSGRRRRRRKTDTNDALGLDNHVDVNSNDLGISSSSADRPFSSPDNGQGPNNHYDMVIDGERTGPYNASVGLTELPTWGNGGQRSNRNNQGNRVDHLANHVARIQIREDNNELETIREQNDELDIIVTLITLDEQNIPPLKWPCISCPQTYSVQQLRQYVAKETDMLLKEVELYVLRNPIFPAPISLPVYDPSQGDKRLLKSKETLVGLDSDRDTRDMLVLGYGRKFY